MGGRGLTWLGKVLGFMEYNLFSGKWEQKVHVFGNWRYILYDKVYQYVLSDKWINPVFFSMWFDKVL